MVSVTVTMIVTGMSFLGPMKSIYPYLQPSLFEQAT